MSFSKKPKTIDPDAVDPSVYYYDEVYDDMKADVKPSTSNSDATIKKESKYIKGLIETAEQRKTDKEIRKFKKYTRDKDEAESKGELDNTDIYITASYKNKLKEIKRLEEDKRKRFRDDKDCLMNFAKKERKVEATNVPESDKADSNIKEYTKSTQADDNAKSELDSSKPGRRPLRTIEDRREYLKEILAKRTIGARFEAAVQRYKERKRLYGKR